MSLRALLLVSLPLMVTPLFSLPATPAQASQNSQPQLSSELLSSIHADTSILVADRYDGDRDDSRRYGDRDNYRRYGDRDNYRRYGDRDNYRRYGERSDYRRDDYRQYRDRPRVGVFLQF